MPEEYHIDVLLIPANCIDWLEPLDISVNKAVKVSSEMSLKIGMPTKSKFSCETVNLSMSVVKSLGVTWSKNTFGYLKMNPQIANSGFHKVGLL